MRTLPHDDARQQGAEREEEHAENKTHHAKREHDDAFDDLPQRNISACGILHSELPRSASQVDSRKKG